MRRIITLACSAILIASVGPAFAAESNSAPPNVKPVLLNLAQVVPRYPEKLTKKGITGGVVLQFRLDEKGKPQDVKVLQADPKDTFEKHALYTVSKMRFSVPPEWLASHPDRVLDFGILYLVDRCLVEDNFPDVQFMTLIDWSVNSWRDANKMMDACAKERALRKERNQPAQQSVPAAGSTQSED
ncbi:MAG: energy transducer TonB [Gammaproteobacteria bacterium]|nr:energy transducer TonB [Gammaproteobacteria bacterium]